MTRLAAFLVLLFAQSIPFPGPGGGGGACATHNGYCFVRSVTIDHLQAGTVDSTDFPVKLDGTYSYLATTANGGNVYSSTGLDIVYATSSACSTLLDFQRVLYVAATGEIEMHFRQATLSHTVDGVVYECYGNSTISTDQSNANGTWNSAHKVVQHFADGTTLDLSDSTSNANNGTNHSAAAVAGQIDGGAGFTAASSQYVDDGSSATLTGITSAITVQAWLKFSGTLGSFFIPVSSYDGSNGYELLLHDSTGTAANAFYFQVVKAGVVGASNAGATIGAISINTWYHVVGTYNGTTVKCYLNGVQQTASAASLDLGASSGSLSIGRRQTGSLYWQGSIDEVRVSNVERSPSWILATYNNTKPSSTMLTISAPL